MVLMLERCWYSLILLLERRWFGLILGWLERRWFSLVLGLERRNFTLRHPTSLALAKIRPTSLESYHTSLAPENDSRDVTYHELVLYGNQGLILPPPSLFPLMEKLLLSNQRWESKYIQRCDLASRTNLTLTYKSLTPPKDSALKSCVLVSPCACSCLQIILFCFLLNDQRGKILFARIDRS